MNLNLADLEGGLFKISSLLGLIKLFLYSSKSIIEFALSSGKYLEGLDLFLE